MPKTAHQFVAISFNRCPFADHGCSTCPKAIRSKSSCGQAAKHVETRHMPWLGQGGLALAEWDRCRLVCCGCSVIQAFVNIISQLFCEVAMPPVVKGMPRKRGVCMAHPPDPWAELSSRQAPAGQKFPARMRFCGDAAVRGCYAMLCWHVKIRIAMHGRALKSGIRMPRGHARRAWPTYGKIVAGTKTGHQQGSSRQAP